MLLGVFADKAAASFAPGSKITFIIELLHLLQRRDCDGAALAKTLTESLLARTRLSSASDNRIVEKAEDTGSVFLCRSDGIDEALHSGPRPVRVAVLSSRGARWPPETANRCQTGTEHMTHHDAVVQRHHAMLGTIFRSKIVSRHSWTVLQQVRCTA